MDKDEHLSKLKSLKIERGNGVLFASPDECMQWIDNVLPLLKYDQQHYQDFYNHSQYVRVTSLSSDTLMAHLNHMIGIVSQSITELENNIVSPAEEIVVPKIVQNPSAGVSIIEKLKQHWLIAVLIIGVVVAGTTWKVAIELLVAPRDFQITQLRDEIQQLKAALPPARATSTTETSIMLEQTGVFAGTSITTRDGRCSVRVISVSESSISLSIIIDSSKPAEYKNRRPGDRITIEASDRFYYIDLHRIRGDIVDIEIFSHMKPA